MKLLLDQNISSNWTDRICRLFPGSKHVKDFDFTAADDTKIWEFARDNGFVIVSKDTDFLNRSLLHGHPPKFIHVRAGNCTARHIVELLEVHTEMIQQFGLDETESYYSLG